MKQIKYCKRLTVLMPVLLALLLASTVLLGACGETTTTTTDTTTTPTISTSATTTPSGPQYGGILKLISPSGAVNLGYPFEDVGFEDGTFLKPCLEGLVVIDENNNIAPKLATDWENSSDYTTYTFILRQGVVFHDGTPFNAEAVKYNMELYIEKTTYPTWKLISSIDIIDDYTIRLNLSSPDPTFIIGNPCLAHIVSPTAVETMGKETCMINPVGTGPFQFVSFERDASLKFERFDGYWDEGKPYLDGIEWLFIADPVTSLLAFKKGDGHVIRSLAPNDAGDLKATGNYNFNIVTMTVEGMIGDSAHADSPFSDIRVRQAIAYAINTEAINEATSYGFAGHSNQILPKENSNYNPEVVGYPYNPEKAKELLSQAGYNNDLEFTITYKTNPGTNEIWTAVQGYLSDVGITAKIEGATIGKLIQDCTSSWNDAMIWTGFPGSPEADLIQMLDNHYSENAMWYPDLLHPDDYSELLAQAVTEADFAKRNAMGRELVKMIIDEYCLVIPVFASNGITAIYPEVNDLDFGIMQLNWNPANAWLSK